MFLETSAKTGENVEEAFLKCSKTILVKIETGIDIFLMHGKSILIFFLRDCYSYTLRNISFDFFIT